MAFAVIMPRTPATPTRKVYVVGQRPHIRATSFKALKKRVAKAREQRADLPAELKWAQYQLQEAHAAISGTLANASDHIHALEKKLKDAKEQMDLADLIINDLVKDLDDAQKAFADVRYELDTLKFSLYARPLHPEDVQWTIENQIRPETFQS